MGDADYLHAFQSIVMPIAMEFSPELVISKTSRLLLFPPNNIHLQFLLDSMLPMVTI